MKFFLFVSEYGTHTYFEIFYQSVPKYEFGEDSYSNFLFSWKVFIYIYFLSYCGLTPPYEVVL